MSAKRILLVEDEPDILGILDIALRGVGYAVDTAMNVTRAMVHLSQQPYALVATDWRLPDGYGTAIADCAADLGAKTILFSGYLFSIPAEQTKRHELLMKPMRSAELAAAVERCIGKAA
jgi:DNA-binding NtrC family response regulator